MKIVYHGHSGFSVQTDHHLLIFDYLGEGLKQPQKQDHALVFVSHSHSDHFHPLVVRWMQEGHAALITGDDVDAGGLSMKEGDRAQIDGVDVEAFGSTDQGVSFLVHVDGMDIFHAGDYNFWHWKHESTEEEIREAEEWFERILNDLRGKHIDVAFFPVDPRMGEGYEEGAMRFIEAVKPVCFIPMHFWDKPEAACLMQEKTLPEGVSVHALTAPGDTVII